MIDTALNLLLVENTVFNLRMPIGKENIFENKNNFSGKHNKYAFLFKNRDINIKIPLI